MKPGVILKLEQGEEPWTGDGEIPSSDSLGECMKTRQRREGGSHSQVVVLGILEMCLSGLFSKSQTFNGDSEQLT